MFALLAWGAFSAPGFIALLFFAGWLFRDKVPARFGAGLSRKQRDALRKQKHPWRT